MDVNKLGLDKLCKSICPIGWAYTGQGVHKKKPCFYFQMGNYATGFKEMICFEEDLAESNLLLMVKYNVTR